MVSKTLKATISGSFKASDGDIESFERVQGTIPRLDTEGNGQLSKAEQMIIRRYAMIWIGQQRKKNADGKLLDEPKYKRVKKVREVFIDSIEDNEGMVMVTDPKTGKEVEMDAAKMQLSYVGKNIMEMNFEELQDLAAANDLSAVPLFKVNSLTHARRVAWSEYARKVQNAIGPEFEYTNQAFNPSKHEPLIADGEIRQAGGHVASIEETLDRVNLSLQGKAKENVTDPSRSRLTLAQLKAIADEKKISYHPKIGYEALYKSIYQVAA